MKIVCFVPIKLKSERLPGKMLLPLGDKLVINHIFDTLCDIQTEHDIDVYCYCSDTSIGDILPQKVNVLQRDSKLDTNETIGIDIYKSFVALVDADVYVLCHATSPFIKGESILEGINRVINDGYDSSFAVSRIQTFCWYKGSTLNYNTNNVVRTQDIEPVYYETSAFYVFTKNVIESERRIGDNPYLVETNRIESIDLDEPEDYELALKCV